MNATLTDRYVEATARALDQEQRSEVQRELRATIEDMIEGRLESGAESREEAERSVLLELGDPARLAAGYSGRPLYLIGPDYYLVWLRLVKLLLAVVVPLVAVIRLSVALFTEDGAQAVGQMVVDVLFAITLTTAHIGFWTTLTFAVLERMAPSDRPQVTWDPDTLPDDIGRRVSLGETIGSVISLVFLALALVWQQTSSPLVDDGERLPILDPALWSSWLPVLIAVVVAQIGHALWVYRERRWTVRLAVVYAVLDVAFAAIVLVLAVAGRLLNPEFVDLMVAGGWSSVERNLGFTTSIGVLVVAGWSSVEGFRRARQVASGE